MNIPSSLIYETVLFELNKDTEFTKTQQINYYPNSNKIAVIVDPRFNLLMEAVIRNFMFFMNPCEWNLCIVSYSGYEKLIKSVFPNCIFIAIDETYIYMKNNIPNITIENYNKMFLNTAFWKRLPGEHILIFQTDCIMYKMFPDYYLEYDYCGANYYSDNSILYGGINGGCSLRKKSTMIECIEKINWNKDIPDYKTKLYQNYKNYNNISCKIRNKNSLYNIFNQHITFCNEDVFFTHGCEILLKIVPDKIHRMFFATECDIYADTCMYHGWNKNYHNKDFAIHMLQKSVLFKKYIELYPSYSNETQNMNSTSMPDFNSTSTSNMNDLNNGCELNKSIPILDNISYNNIAD
jgi:hypothetical protein